VKSVVDGNNVPVFVAPMLGQRTDLPLTRQTGFLPGISGVSPWFVRSTEPVLVKVATITMSL